MQGRDIRDKLRSGQCVYGTHIVEAGNPNMLLWELEAGMDFAFICTEHLPVDRKEVSWMCRLIAQQDVSPAVRIPYPSAHWATMMIDGGAQGIVAPYVEKPEQVEELIGAVRYRPIKGVFLEQILTGAREPADKLKTFFDKFSGDLYLIIGVESVHAIENLDRLLAYDEVDGVFLGPHDITCSMEIPEEYENPRFLDTLKDVVRVCREKNKGVGLHCDYRVPLNEQMIDWGMNFILNLSDVTKARNALAEDFEYFRAKKNQG